MRKRSAKHSFQENLANHKAALRSLLTVAKDDIERSSLHERIAEIENAIHMDGWLRSGLTRPN